jgi:hypothetical protein
MENEKNDLTFRVEKLEDKVSTMDKDLGIFASSVDRFDRTVEKLDSTLNTLCLSLATLQANYKNTDDEVKKLKEESTFSILGWINKNLIWIIGMSFIALYLLGLISK